MRSNLERLMKQIKRSSSLSGRRRRPAASHVALVCCVLLCVFTIPVMAFEELDSPEWSKDSDFRCPSKSYLQTQGAGEGIGSAPPRCASKCGECTPCRPVHVSVPPGNTPVTTEYYPEAWRCKCGDKLYMP